MARQQKQQQQLQQRGVSRKPHSPNAVWVRFALTSAAMWVLPLAILFAFTQDTSSLKAIIPSWLWSLLVRTDPSAPPLDYTLWGGLAAVLAVNAVIAVYIILALRDAPSSDQPHPDPAFVAAAARRQQEIAGVGGEDEGDEGSGGGSGAKRDGGGRSGAAGLRKRREDMTAGEAEAEAIAAAARASGTGQRRGADRKGKKQS